MAHVSPRLCGMTVKKLGQLSFIKNFPKAYIDAEKKAVPKRRFDNRFGAPERVVWKANPELYEETAFRPWERKAQYHQKELNWRAKMSGQKRDGRVVPKSPVPLPPEDWFFFLGDEVKIMVGKDKGKLGVVKAITRETNSVFVDGLNTSFEYMAGNANLGFDGNLIRIEEPLDAARGEVKLVRPLTSEEVELEWRQDTETGELHRVDLHTQQAVPIPIMSASRTYEYMTPDTYSENPKDTRKSEALRRTYKPSLSSFEEEIMAEYDIVETRKHPKTYFY